MDYAEKIKKVDEWTKDSLLDQIFHFVVETDQVLHV